MAPRKDLLRAIILVIFSLLYPILTSLSVRKGLKSSLFLIWGEKSKTLLSLIRNPLLKKEKNIDS